MSVTNEASGVMPSVIAKKPPPVKPKPSKKQIFLRMKSAPAILRFKGESDMTSSSSDKVLGILKTKSQDHLQYVRPQGSEQQDQLGQTSEWAKLRRISKRSKQKSNAKAIKRQARARSKAKLNDAIASCAAEAPVADAEVEVEAAIHQSITQPVYDNKACVEKASAESLAIDDNIVQQHKPDVPLVVYDNNSCANQSTPDRKDGTYDNKNCLKYGDLDESSVRTYKPNPTLLAPVPTYQVVSVEEDIESMCSEQMPQEPEMNLAVTFAEEVVEEGDMATMPRPASHNVRLSFAEVEEEGNVDDHLMPLPQSKRTSLDVEPMFFRRRSGTMIKYFEDMARNNQDEDINTLTPVRRSWRKKQTLSYLSDSSHTLEFQAE